MNKQSVLEKYNGIADEFAKFFEEHEDIDFLFEDKDQETTNVEKMEKIIAAIRPVAADILVGHEYTFVRLINKLIKKHRSLANIQDIIKLNNDIDKLCK